jgi:hypothetical protein
LSGNLKSETAERRAAERAERLLVEGRESGGGISNRRYFWEEPACFNNMPATKATKAASSHCIRHD